MKQAIVGSLFIAGLLVAGAGWAEVGKTSPSMAPDTGSASHHPPAPGTAAADSSGSQMSKMDAQMREMQSLHERVMNASTPEERQKAMAEQEKAMQDCMGMMSSMQGGAGGGGMMGSKGRPVDMDTKMQMMTKRMDMMQMMMQSMMDQRGMVNAPKGDDGPAKK